GAGAERQPARDGARPLRGTGQFHPLALEGAAARPGALAQPPRRDRLGPSPIPGRPIEPAPGPRRGAEAAARRPAERARSLPAPPARTQSGAPRQETRALARLGSLWHRRGSAG